MSLPRSAVPDTRWVRTKTAVATSNGAMGSTLLQVDDEKPDQLFEILRRAQDLAADARGAFAVGLLHVGDVAHFEVHFKRLVQRVTDSRVLERCAGHRLQGGAR